MRFSSDAQRRAVFSRFNRFSNGSLNSAIKMPIAMPAAAAPEVKPVDVKANAWRSAIGQVSSSDPKAYKDIIQPVTMVRDENEFMKSATTDPYYIPPQNVVFAHVSPMEVNELRARRAKLMIEVSGLEPMKENRARRHELIGELEKIDDVLEAV